MTYAQQLNNQWQLHNN